MTRTLEETFNLAPLNDPKPIPQEDSSLPANAAEVMLTANEVLDKIDQALPQVKELENSDVELDELATLAKEKFDDLITLGLNVDPRFAGTIFQTAGTLLGHAITAKTAKVDRKLRTLEIQIRKARLDATNNKKDDNDQPPIEGKAQVLDRNSLLSSILGELKKSKDSGK